MGEPVRVLIADDHPPTRVGIRTALETRGFVIAAEVGNGPAAVDAAVREQPDLCLLDVNMPGGGIPAAAQIRASTQTAAIVMLTVSRDDNDLFDALRVGASGYLLKDIDPDRLPDALEGVLAGEAALPRHLVARLIDEFRNRGRRRMLVAGRRSPELTAREWEVLDLMHQGLSTKRMAERLFVSQVTVRTHVSAVLKKLQVPDRAAAVRLLQGPE